MKRIDVYQSIERSYKLLIPQVRRKSEGMATAKVLAERKKALQQASTSNMAPEKVYHNKRRNTENILPGTLDPSRCRQNNHSHHSSLKSKDDESCRCTKRRHTFVSGVTPKELFEMETKLIFLEFLKTTTPRFKIDKFKRLNSSVKSPRKKKPSESEKEVKNVDNSAKQSGVRKRDAKKQRKVSGNKSKTVTIGESEHQELCKLQQKQKYQRSSSDLTSQQYLMMKRKFEEMQLPIIQWLKSHAIPEIEEQGDQDYRIPEITTTTIDENTEIEEVENPSEIETDDFHEEQRSALPPPRPRGLTINIPRRSIALQLVESDIFTPQTVAVQKLDRISEEIMRDYGEVLEASMADLLNPIRATNSITYSIFSKVADKVFNFATKSTVARLAMLLNLVKETMVEGNLNEEQLELLVDYSTKFFTENAPESPLKEGNGWVDFGLNGQVNTFLDSSSDSARSSDSETSDEKSLSCEDTQDENVWAPYGIAALTVGLGLTYTYLKS